jgi:IMP dehydrogenase
MIIKDALSFDDVLLVPQKSSISSRFSGEIDLSVEILPGVTLKYPLISSNMDTVTEFRMSQKMFELGGLGIIHRFMDVAQHLEQVSATSYKILCIGVGEGGIKRLQSANKCYLKLDGVLIDVAHGHSDAIIEQIKKIKQIDSNISVVAGNVATYHGAKDLINAGADCIKAGVGPGAVCTTRIQTGCGVPQLTAVMDVVRAAKECDRKVTVISDGGIKNSGDCIKALAVGADALMIGMLFAGTKEAPGDIIKLPGKPALKIYRGMASREAQESWKGKASSVEGEMTWINYKGSVENIFGEIVSGMLSGMSYQNAKNLQELRENAEFVKMTSGGLKESMPHGIL